MSEKINYRKLVLTNTNLNEKQLDSMIKNKIDELKGLISTEGATFIISKELGLDIKQLSKIKKKSDKHMETKNPYFVAKEVLDGMDEKEITELIYTEKRLKGLNAYLRTCFDGAFEGKTKAGKKFKAINLYGKLMMIYIKNKELLKSLGYSASFKENVQDNIKYVNWTLYKW